MGVVVRLGLSRRRSIGTSIHSSKMSLENVNVEELSETTGLDMEQIEALKKGFEGFDKENSGIISGTAMQMIFKMMGVNVQKTQLDEAINDRGDDPTDGKFDFVSFCAVASKFLIEEDAEQMKEMLKEIDPGLTNDDLDNIIEEVDEDGSGTLDF